MGSVKKFGWIEFLTGFTAGSVISLIFTRKNLRNDFSYLQRKAEEIKNQLLGKAKSISSDLVDRSQRFIESSKKFADGKYSGSIESLEKEYYSLRFAINSAIDNYRRSSRVSQPEMDDLFIDFDDETLPKFVGMGKRKR